MEIALALLQLVIELFKDTIAVVVIIFLVWVILAAVTSEIQDWISSLFKWRALMLEDTIEQMLGRPLKERVYDHPLIRGLFTNQGTRKPGSIPYDKFVLVLFHEVLNSGVTSMQGQDDLDELKKKIAALKHEDDSYLQGFAVTLETLLIGINSNITEAQMRVESWLNDSLIQLSGAYRRRLQVVGIIIGITIAFAFNVDTGAIASSVWRNPAVREALVEQASELQTSETPPIGNIAETVDQLNALSLPIGWSANNMPINANGWAGKITGILVSGLAAAQGAPYWFEFMRNLFTRKPRAPQQPA